MKCPECGANLKKISPKCTECGAQLKAKAESAALPRANVAESSAPATLKQTKRSKPSRSLIEFPGVNRSALPEWRKELSERVREKQERKAREAVLEAQGLVTTTVDNAAEPTPVILELLPQTELPPVNPIVQAALKRLERANLQPSTFSHGNAALATAVAYEEQRGFSESETSAIADSLVEPTVEITEEAKPERVHNLTVVPNPPVIEEDVPVVVTKPRRLISDVNDPALNYLDTVPTTVLVERREYVTASSVRRALAAFVDLAILFVLSSPLLALNSLSRLDWLNWRVIAFSAASVALVGFLYLTIVTAFTGRTLGMRLFSLRVVDARNGLIPTGGQSAARAFVYLLSLVSAGILSLYVLLDSENKALHDRITRTAVIRA